MGLEVALLSGAPLNIAILVLVIVNHFKMRDICKEVRKAHERLDRHLEKHT